MQSKADVGMITNNFHVDHLLIILSRKWGREMSSHHLFCPTRSPKLKRYLTEKSSEWFNNYYENCRSIISFLSIDYWVVLALVVGMPVQMIGRKLVESFTLGEPEDVEANISNVEECDLASSSLSLVQTAENMCIAAVSEQTWSCRGGKVKQT